MKHKVSLYWYCKTPRGWLRFPALYKQEHGADVARVGYVMERGEEKHYPEGRFQLKTWKDGRTVYTNVPEHVGEHGFGVAKFREREERLVNTKDTARKAVTIRQAIDRYVADLKARNVLEAAEQARVTLEEFNTVCSSQLLKLITRDCILRFYAALRKRGLSERTIANKHMRVRAFLRFHKFDLSNMPPTPKFEKKKPQIYKAADIVAIRDAASKDDNRMLLVIDLGLMLGLREQEIMHAEWSDVDFDRAVFRVQGKPEYEFAVKDMEQRDITIPAELLSRLAAWHKSHPDSTLIVGDAKGRPDGNLLRALKRLAERYGLNCGRCAGCTAVPNPKWKDSRVQCRRWTLHQFRRTYLTTLLRSGVDASTVQHFAGHSDLDTTLRYLSPADTDEMQTKINAVQFAPVSIKAPRRRKSKK